MPDFPHLTLKQKLDGRYQFPGTGRDKVIDQRTEANLNDKAGHGNRLSNAVESLTQDYGQFLKERDEQGLPEVFNANIVPVFLQVDPFYFDIEALKGFGIEIISEEQDGYIIGANADNFRSLSDKIQAFINDGKAKNTAMLWQIVRGTQWRADYILSDELREKYIAGIGDEAQFTVDISVACYMKYPERPIRTEDETAEHYQKALEKYWEKAKAEPGKEHKAFRAQWVQESSSRFQARISRWQLDMQTAELERDEIASQRQEYLRNFIEVIYRGKLLSGFIDLEDSFGFMASMSGQALKDLIRGYPYVFEINETEQIDNEQHIRELENPDDVEIITPSDDSPTICVIDSGMQEQHILLAPAIIPTYSRNYVPNENTTSDQVLGGGHGTKVAGAILFGNDIPMNGPRQPPCFLINARVLDRDCNLPNTLYPPELMTQIVDDYDDVRLFNLSVASRGPSKSTHMSAWAATIDKLIHERKIMFLLAAGNISSETGSAVRPGITEHLQAGRNYPDFLLEPSSRISNPSQSLLALTVGSVCLAEFEDADLISFGKRGYVSPFSRSGPGIWGSIKPDIVEFGGDWLREKNGVLLIQHDHVSTSVVKTGANRTGYGLGTSFAAPKVAHILAQLAKKFPNDSTLLYKALIVQSARLPEHVFHNPRYESLRMLGFGIPDAQRALENGPYRITFVAEGGVAAQQANLYSINIPDEIKRAGQNYDILIEVTLTYTAAPRRTRKRLKSYFSSWLSWDSSKLGDNFETFSTRVLKNMEDPEDVPIDNDSIRWSIWSSPTWGHIPNVKRQDSATQKDWTVLKSNTLPAELSFAVIGHRGWDKDTASELPFALAISFEAITKENEIYNLIEIANQVEIGIEEAIIIPINRNT
jgi:hypothetical protein